ncbi:MAG: hypothetical protein AAGH92_10815 [Planctomycetota bacterium]
MRITPDAFSGLHSGNRYISWRKENAMRIALIVSIALNLLLIGSVALGFGNTKRVLEDVTRIHAEAEQVTYEAVIADVQRTIDGDLTLIELKTRLKNRASDASAGWPQFDAAFE